MRTEKKVIYATAQDGEQVPVGAIFQKIVNEISNSEKVAQSKGRFIVSHFMDDLMTQEDPFLKSLAILGGQTTVNALGVLLFVMFQAGHTFGSEKYNLNPEDFKHLMDEDQDNESNEAE